MKRDVIDVAYVARLARLDLTEAERVMFQQQLDSVLTYMRQLSELDVDGIEPTAYGQAVRNVFREDVARPGLDRDTAMANAPARLGDTFRVPCIME